MLKERLLTGNDVAQILQFSRAWTYELIKRGIIPAVRIGKAIRVLPDDLESYIYENRLDYSEAAQAFINRKAIEKEK